MDESELIKNDEVASLSSQ